MKTIFITSLLLALFIISSCEKETDEISFSAEDYVGTWYNTERSDRIFVDSSLSRISYYQTGDSWSTRNEQITDDGISFTIKRTITFQDENYSWQHDFEGVLSSSDSLDVTRVYYQSWRPDGGTVDRNPVDWGTYGRR